MAVEARERKKLWSRRRRQIHRPEGGRALGRDGHGDLQELLERPSSARGVREGKPGACCPGNKRLDGAGGAASPTRTAGLGALGQVKPESWGPSPRL